MSRPLTKQRSGTVNAPTSRVRGKKPFVAAQPLEKEKVFKAYRTNIFCNYFDTFFFRGQRIHRP